MTRAHELRREAVRLEEEAERMLEISDREREGAETSRQIGNVVAYVERLEEAAKFARWALDYQEAAGRLSRELRAWEDRAVCCAREPSGRAVCNLHVGHEGPHAWDGEKLEGAA